MTIHYEPGEEIQLDVDSKRKFFAKAMSWRDQRDYEKLVESAKTGDGDMIETEGVLAAVLGRLTRTDPPIEMTLDGLTDVVDFNLIWALNAAVKFNMTYEEKKS